MNHNRKMFKVTASVLLAACLVVTASSGASPAHAAGLSLEDSGIICYAGTSQGTKTYATVTASAVNVRKGPGASYGKVTTLHKGDVVEILEQKTVSGKNWGRYKSGWFRLTGYATLKPETVEKEDSPSTGDIETTETVYATASVNVRKGPGTSYGSFGVLRKGDSVQRIATCSNGWSKIIYKGSEAYVSSKYLKASTSTSSQYPLIYSDSTCTITVYKEWFENAWVYAAHLQFTDYSRLATACAKGKYNSGSETTSKAAERLGAVLAINGDYAVPSNGAGGYAIARDGVVCNDKLLYAEGVYNSNNGLLFYPSEYGCAGKQLSELVTDGKVTDTFQFGPAFLLNGKVIAAAGGGCAQRTFIGTNGKPGDLWLVVSDGRNNDGVSAGLTGEQCARYLVSKGCTFGIPLDGGGSSTMYFNGRVLNAEAGNERKVVDFLYFK